MTHLAEFTCSGSADGFPDLYARSAQRVIVLHRLPPTEVDEEDVGPMYRIRFGDGFEGDAFWDELLCLHDGREDASDCPLAFLGPEL